MKHKVKHISLTRFSFELFTGTLLIIVVYAVVTIVLTDAVTWIKDVLHLAKQLAK